MTRKVHSLALFLCLSGVFAVATASCSSKGGSSSPAPSGTLNPGTYDFGPTTTVQDQCGEGDRFNPNGGQSTLVLAMLDSQTVIFGGLGSYTVYNSAFTLVSGTTYAATLSFTANFTTTALQSGFLYHEGGFDTVQGVTLGNGYDCVQTFTFAQSFGINGPSSVTFTEDDTITLNSGNAADCIAADTSGFAFAPASFPCNTTESATATF